MPAGKKSILFTWQILVNFEVNYSSKAREGVYWEQLQARVWQKAAAKAVKAHRTLLNPVLTAKVVDLLELFQSSARHFDFCTIWKNVFYYYKRNLA